MKLRISAAVAVCLLASSCKTTNSGQKQWVQIQAGDVFDVADAKCKLYAQNFQQGLYAQGSPGFVLGAQLGNAIGNAVRMQEAYKNCMVIEGWKQVPVVKPAPKRVVVVKKKAG
jgi:hypothetical protein